MPLSRSHFLRLMAVPLAAGAPVRAGAQALIPLRIGTTTGDSYAEGMYGKDEGFFAQAGIELDLQLFTNGVSVATALAGNAIDIGIISPVTLASAVDRGVGLVLLCAGGLDNPLETGLLVLDDSGIRTGKDFEGKTVGASGLRDMGSVAMMAWIDQTGGDSSKVKFIEVPFSAMGAALRRGTIAATPVAEPNLTAQLRQGGVHAMTSPHLMDVYGKDLVMIGAWAARTEWAASHHEAIRRFIRAIYTIARWANHHPDASAAILSKYSKVELESVRAMNRAPYAETLRPSMLQGILDVSYRYKVLSRPMKATDLFYHG